MPDDIKPSSLPLSCRELDQYRFLAQRQSRSSLVGGHTSRRKGQSLEFREFTPYQIGDDIRYIDWRASTRYKGQSDWLVRRFVAEEQFKLVISMDVRPTMMLPDVLTKWQMGLWLVEAISWIALKAENEVVLHHLFGYANKPRILQGKRDLRRLSTSLDQFQADSRSAVDLNLEVIWKHLPPTAVWILITDLYFDEGVAQKLAERIVSAQSGFRWVILLELDSWPHERMLLSPGPVRIVGPNGSENNRVEIDRGGKRLDTIQENIEKHRSDFLRSSQLDEKYDVSKFSWKAEKYFDPAKFFRDRFREQLRDEQVWRDLFRKDL